MITHILFVWTLVTVSSGTSYHDWRALSEFTSLSNCKEATRQMRIPDNEFRCVSK